MYHIPDFGPDPTGTVLGPVASFFLFMLGYFCHVLNLLFYLDEKPWAQFILKIAFRRKCDG